MSASTITAEAQAFARLYVRGVAPAIAYREAFRPDSTVKRKAVWKRAQTLLARPEVAAYIETLRAQAAKAAAATVSRDTVAPGRSYLEQLAGMRPTRPGYEAITRGERRAAVATRSEASHGSTLVDDLLGATLGARWRK